MPVRTSGIQDRDAALNGGGPPRSGRALLAAESELLSEALEDVFGWELLQVGAWGSARELLAGSRTRRQSMVAAPALRARRGYPRPPSQLPVVSDCIDAALLPHTLKFAPDPYAILREVDRVLVGEGQLLVLGFRPWSLWGMRARWSRSGFPPACAACSRSGCCASGWCCWAMRSSPERRYCTGSLERGLQPARAPGAMLRAGPHVPAARRGISAQGAQTHLYRHPDPAALAREGRRSSAAW